MTHPSPSSPATRKLEHPDVDLRVIQDVLGWEPRYCVEEDERDRWVKPTGKESPAYEFAAPWGFSPTSDISSAWVVVEALGGIFKLERRGNEWYAGFGFGDLKVWAETPALAICRAALYAVSPSVAPASAPAVGGSL